MTRKKLVKLELTNPRYSRAELKDHASEFIHYARYAGYVLRDFNAHLSASKLHPVKPEISERNHRLSIETTIDNAKMLSQIIRIYPSFGNWRLKMITPISERAAQKSERSAAQSQAKKKVKKAKKKPVNRAKVKKSKKVVKKTKKKVPAAGKKSVKKTAKKAKSAKNKKTTKKSRRK